MISFKNMRDLRNWLVLTEEGRSTLARIVPSPQLLAVQHHDRVDLYGDEKRLSVRKCIMPRVPPEGELMAEELLSLLVGDEPQYDHLLTSVRQIDWTPADVKMLQLKKDLLCAIIGQEPRHVLMDY